MNYARIYYKIIESRLTHPYEGYTETHHIIPVCLGGADTKDNLVELSAREHFICHWLLVKMYKGNKIVYYKMLKAFNMMCNTSTNKQARYKISSRIFARYREDFSKAMSELQIGEKNSQAGTMWICNISTKENKKVSKGNVPNGWIAGRSKWKTQKVRNKQPKQPKQKMSKKYTNGYLVSVNDVIYESISMAADAIGIGHETARMRFKSKSFPNYKIITRTGVDGDIRALGA